MMKLMTKLLGREDVQASTANDEADNDAKGEECEEKGGSGFADIENNDDPCDGVEAWELDATS